MYKMNKGSGRTKPNVHLNIKYKGTILESVKELSDGEIDRISLAVTLSLNKITGNEILILDESISSIPLDKRANCISVIKRIVQKGTYTMVVMHDGIEGIFDDVLSI